MMKTPHFPYSHVDTAEVVEPVTVQKVLHRKEFSLSLDDLTAILRAAYIDEFGSIGDAEFIVHPDMSYEDFNGVTVIIKTPLE